MPPETTAVTPNLLTAEAAQIHSALKIHLFSVGFVWVFF